MISYNQTYGRWDVKAKFPVGYGVTGYIGIFPTSKNWPPEVDFAEFIGRQPQNLYLTQHYGNYQNHQQSGIAFSKSGVNWANDFHKYSLEWTPGSLKYFVDDVIVYNQSISFVAEPMDIAIGIGKSIFFKSR